MIVHHAGADVMLGMNPLAREVLQMGSEVVMVANKLQAINDVTHFRPHQRHMQSVLNMVMKSQVLMWCWA